ncbi:gamma-glutamyltransferase [Pelagerythrobacter rhizovicinus]|uniref:Glutathione hydrolase proenzyme n=1 Tax=Pelagerythrobacter rhizovicinus TaxID=2268576 RepID=A0A4Q2KRU9_9SPHN|nr:gamma-glutamyltransferase [Pelagerythrobacter rhizovicinus]RXZ66412.1 gamma-glutamyltransferase [Pelagerythrobacter rhizovicinus]
MKRLATAVAVIALCLSPMAHVPLAGQQQLLDYDTIHHPVVDDEAMVVSQNQLASRIGAQIMAEGGNAVDAAVATGFALAVTLPRAGNLGGGGFMLVYLASENRTVAIDYRSAAPAAAEAKLFLDRKGRRKDNADYGHMAAAVPGTVAGLKLAHERWGSLPWERVVRPAVEIARDGIVVTRDLSEALRWGRKRLESSDAAMATFFKPDGSPYVFGEKLRQPELAWTLERIATAGADDFYRGEIAKRIVADMEAQGGLIAASDLAAYEAKLREPIATDYRGLQVVTMPPASSGGVALLEMLNMLERFNLREMGHNSASTVHILSETMKLAYADRRKSMGDPDFVQNPVSTLISKAYAQERARLISRERSTPPEMISPFDPFAGESPDTTHFSVVDKQGNVVSNTYTLGSSFGSGALVEGAGFLLDNQIKNFSLRVNVPGATFSNSEMNKIEPGKRMLSSMTPTIVFREGKPYMVVGSPGGSTIINTVLQIILNVVDHDMNIAEATFAPRMHQNWKPSELELEPGFNIDSLRVLESLGHEIEVRDTIGSAQTIMLENGKILGAADPRRPGAAAVGVSNLRAFAE